MRLDCLPEQGNMPIDGGGHSVAITLPERGASFDIGEEKSDGTAPPVQAWHALDRQIQVGLTVMASSRPACLGRSSSPIPWQSHGCDRRDFPIGQIVEDRIRHGRLLVSGGDAGGLAGVGGADEDRLHRGRAFADDEVSAPDGVEGLLLPSNDGTGNRLPAPNLLTRRPVRGRCPR